MVAMCVVVVTVNEWITVHTNIIIIVTHIPSGVSAAPECELGQVESGDSTHETGGRCQAVSPPPRLQGRVQTTVATALKTTAL